MKLKSFVIALVTCFTGSAIAQPSTTEIWLVDLVMTKGKPAAGTPLRITQNTYYDNQPCFSKDGTLLWYASMPDTTQSDIYQYNIKKKEFVQITQSPESEFQPQQIPYLKNKLSVVRVEMDKTQRLTQIGFDGSDVELLMPNEDSVAYYCWVNDTTCATYMLDGAGGKLEEFDMKPQQAIILMTENIGRCLVKIPGTSNFCYVIKDPKGKSVLMRYEMATEDRFPVTEMPAGVEDYTIAPDGKIYCALGTQLLYFDPANDGSTWQLVADFAKTVGTFYRLTISPKGDKLALVSYTGVKP